jgi:hypothetical protein
MGWADRYIAELRAGRPVSFRPRGNSMAGYVPSGSLVTVVPRTHAPQAGQIVLCKVSGSQYLHFAAVVRGDRVRIENAKGHVNGWTPFQNIYGIVTSIDGRPLGSAKP